MRMLECGGCKNAAFKLKEQIFANGTKHVRAQCAGCGKFFQYLPQREPNELEAEIRMLQVKIHKLEAKMREQAEGPFSARDILLGF